MKNIIKKYLGINYIFERASYNEHILEKLQEENYELQLELHSLVNDLRAEILELSYSIDVNTTNLNDLESKVDEIEGNVDENMDEISGLISGADNVEAELEALRELFNELEDRLDD